MTNLLNNSIVLEADKATAQAVADILNTLDGVAVTSVDVFPLGDFEIGVELYGGRYPVGSEHEHFSFSIVSPARDIARDDFSGSVQWGRVEDGSLKVHATEAFKDDGSNWMDRLGRGKF
jgi:hypothetical protein